jgi:hypothetical protein
MGGDEWEMSLVSPIAVRESGDDACSNWSEVLLLLKLPVLEVEVATFVRSTREAENCHRTWAWYLVGPLLNVEHKLGWLVANSLCFQGFAPRFGITEW